MEERERERERIRERERERETKTGQGIKVCARGRRSLRHRCKEKWGENER